MPTHHHETGVWDYTPDTAKVAGELVFLGKLIGVVSRPIAAGEKGAINTAGVFAFTKGTGAALTPGQVAYLQANGHVTGSATTTGIAGIVTVTAASLDTTVYVDINKAPLYDLNATGPANT